MYAVVVVWGHVSEYLGGTYQLNSAYRRRVQRLGNLHPFSPCEGWTSSFVRSPRKERSLIILEVVVSSQTSCGADKTECRRWNYSVVNDSAVTTAYPSSSTNKNTIFPLVWNLQRRGAASLTWTWNTDDGRQSTIYVKRRWRVHSEKLN